jgi:hypothetical protein
MRYKFIPVPLAVGGFFAHAKRFILMPNWIHVCYRFASYSTHPQLPMVAVLYPPHGGEYFPKFGGIGA